MFDYAGDLVRNPDILSISSALLDDDPWIRLNEIKRTEDPHKFWKTIPVKHSPFILCTCD